MKPSIAVTSSGFVFERRGDVVTLTCKHRLQPLAELEYLREVEPGRAGRIVDVERRAEAGRAQHLVRVAGSGETAGRVVVFDIGPAWLGRLRLVHETLGYVVYGLGAVVGLGGLVYAISILLR